jgi:5'(3')-deoxyribonucleotidase
MANIGIDLDDVLADFISAYTEKAHAIYGRPALGTAPIDWEWSNFGLTRDEQNVVWADIARTANFWAYLGVEQGASRDQLLALDYKHNVSYITARVRCHGDSVLKQSCRWLLNKYSIPFPQVLVAYDKGALAAALKLDYFIDDRPKNVLEIKAAVPTCKVFLKDASHNQTFSHPEIPRVKNFDVFASIVTEETNG